MRRLSEKRRDIFIGIGIFLVLVGLLPFLGLKYGETTLIRNALDVILVACGIVILILR